MFKWIGRWKIFRRRRQRRYLQEELLSLLRNECLGVKAYFMCRLRDYNEIVFDPILSKRKNRLQQIWNHPYSRPRDEARAFRQVRQDFLEAVKYAL